MCTMNGAVLKQEDDDPHYWHKRAWSRSYPAPLMAAPPRLLLVALLSVQILVLALIRYAPSRGEWLWPAASPPPPARLGPISPVDLAAVEGDHSNVSKTHSPTLDSYISNREGHALPEEQRSFSEKIIEAESVPKSENPPRISDSLGQEGQTLVSEALISDSEISTQCQLGRFFVYNLPSVFNEDLIARCSSLNPWNNLCPFLDNDGLGQSLGNKSPLGQEGSWYSSDQFTLEVVFHRRMLQHPCVTDKPELASAFYVPFYAGLDVGRYLWLNSSAEERDHVAKQLLEWLDGQQYWRRNGGWDHFLIVGRITWDFRRSKDLDWGSGFFYIPPVLNTTRLLIERNPWDDNEMAVPYPNSFHPKSYDHLRAWQEHLRGLKRSSLFSFAGAPRKMFPNDFRAILLEQCQHAESCKSLDCAKDKCSSSQAALELFLDSSFCLQPRGDSFTRRSTFDCLVAGSIPVFFWHRSAYWQYKWHLPEDEQSYSVFISKNDMRNGTKVEEVLKAIPPEKVQSMREAVIESIPRLVYAASGDSLKGTRDAFDIAVEGVLKKFRSMKLGSGR